MEGLIDILETCRDNFTWGSLVLGLATVGLIVAIYGIYGILETLFIFIRGRSVFIIPDFRKSEQKKD